ncbi:cupin, partial [Lysinibacillus sp. D4B1_S16]|uniref:cupin n=1 Tax=Lysinibacillus sp. D4B1_S16 TaxID=2941231 RepID=UPI0020C02526
FIYIEANGLVGMHEAPVPPLLIVIQGEGWVCGEDGKRVDIAAGDEVLWQQGQAHESGSTTGLTELVIQAEQINLT